MATKKKQLRPSQALRLAQNAARDRWWKCKHQGCLFTTPDERAAKLHLTKTRHVLETKVELTAPAAGDLSPAARAVQDAQALLQRYEELRLQVDALADSFASVPLPRGSLNELLACTSRMGEALESGSPNAEALVKVLRRIARRERMEADSKAEPVEREAEARAEQLNASDKEVRHG